MADLETLQNKALERGASSTPSIFDRSCGGEVVDLATTTIENSVLGSLDRASAQPRLQAAAAVGAWREGHGETRAGEGAGVLGGTARQSSGDFLLVGRRGRGARKRRKISEIWANGGVCRVRRVGGDHQVVGGARECSCR